jgi:hypothetical protein
MSISLNLDFEQVKALVDQLSPAQKEQIEKSLRRELALEHLQKLQQELKDVPITDEEIEAEVETVRQERYQRRMTT